MGCRAIGVYSGESVRFDNAVADLFACVGQNAILSYSFKRQFFDRNDTAHAGKATVSEIGQDAQMNPSARDGFDARGQPFAGGVDSVGAHRVAHVINEMNDDEGNNRRRFDNADLEIARAAAELFEDGVNRIRFGQQFGFVLVDFEPSRVDIVHVQQLHLTDHLGGGGGGLESAACADQLRHERCSRHHGRLFQRHRDEYIAFIHLEVQRDAQRQTVQADDIFDHVLGGLSRESARRKREQVFGSQRRGIRQFGAAFFESQIVKSRNAGSSHPFTFVPYILLGSSAKTYQAPKTWI